MPEAMIARFTCLTPSPVAIWGGTLTSDIRIAMLFLNYAPSDHHHRERMFVMSEKRPSYFQAGTALDQVSRWQRSSRANQSISRVAPEPVTRVASSSAGTTAAAHTISHAP